MTPEHKVKKKLKEWLSARGAYYFCPVQQGYGQTSVDFLCCRNGEFWAIETKAGRNKLTALQELTMQQMKRAGAQCWVVRLEKDELSWTECG